MTQERLHHVYGLQTLSLKMFEGNCYFVDLYAGRGFNFVPQEESTKESSKTAVLPGSPITLLAAMKNAMRFIDFTGTPTVILNDVDADRYSQLSSSVRRWADKSNVFLGSQVSSVSFLSKNQTTVDVKLQYSNHTAKHVLDKLAHTLYMDSGSCAIITIDPNVPSDIPYDSLKSLYAKYRDRVTVIVGISAGAMKRISGNKAVNPHLNFKYVPDNLFALLDLLESNSGFIREPITTGQWTVLVLTPVKQHWLIARSGFHIIKSDSGKKLIDKLSVAA